MTQQDIDPVTTTKKRNLRQVSQLVRHDFVCPAHGASVTVPCGLSECKFHVEHALANNCVLAYCHQQDTQQLSAEEISYLYDLPYSEVSESLDRSLVAIRVDALRAESQEDPELKRQFDYIRTDKVCCACGSLVDTIEFKIPDQPFAYCSQECMDEKPPAVVNLEVLFGRPIKLIILWGVNKFKNLPALERTFGLSRSLLAALCVEHTGRAITAYYPKTKIVGDVGRHLRKNPDRQKIDLLREAGTRLFRQAAIKFGRSTIDLSALRSEVDALLSGS